jgi:hypothetical protein
VSLSGKGCSLQPTVDFNDIIASKSLSSKKALIFMKRVMDYYSLLLVIRLSTRFLQREKERERVRESFQRLHGLPGVHCLQNKIFLSSLNVFVHSLISTLIAAASSISFLLIAITLASAA